MGRKGNWQLPPTKKKILRQDFIARRMEKTEGEEVEEARGQMEVRSRVPLSNNTKCLKVACERLSRKQNPCPFHYLNFPPKIFIFKFGLWKYI